MIRIVGFVFLALVISLFGISGSSSNIADGESTGANHQINPKIDSLLALQVDAKLHYGIKEGDIDMSLATGSPENQRVFIHFEQEPTPIQISELKSHGVKVNADSWIPPLPNHPTGFLSAQMPPAVVYEIADISFISSMNTAEIICEPQNDLAAAATKADVVWNGSPSFSGTGVKIAILDSGFEVGHPDFPTWMTGGTNYKDYSTDATGPDDYDVANCCTGHGTHVAGIALGRGTAGSPTGIYKGMAYEATPVLLKIGGDSNAGAWPEAIVAAFKAAVDEYNADVITISYGAWSIYHDGSDEECQAIDYAVSQGAVVFAGAGNSASTWHHYSGVAPANSWSDWIAVTVSGTNSFYYNLVWYDGTETSNDLEMHYYASGTSTEMNPITTYPQSESPRGTECEISYYGDNEELHDVSPGTYYLRVRNYSDNSQLFHIYNMLSSGLVRFAIQDKNYTIISPAEADGAIAVGASYSRNQWWDYANVIHGSSATPGGITGFSSWGPRIDGADKPGIIVPGATIISMRDSDVNPDSSCNSGYISNNGPNEDSITKNDGSCGSGLNEYRTMAGTSMSSPHAAGLAALLLEAHPDWTPDQVRYALESSAVDKGDAGRDNIWGWGLVNVGSAMGVTPPAIVSCNASGTETNRFAFGDTVYVKGYDLQPNTSYKLWLQTNGVTETKQLDISEDPSGSVETVVTSGSGTFTPTAVWTIPGTASSIGEYDIVADNQTSGTGTYRAIEDALDSIAGYGLTTGVIYVNATATGNNDGTSWKDAYINLQQALSNAGSPSQIWVASGTYTPVPPGQSGTRTDSFQMKNGVEIYGGFPNVGTPSWNDRDWETYETILSGEIGNSGTKADNCYHVFYHPGTLTNEAILDGFTITGGNANEWPHDCGGGMHNEKCSPTITNCTFTGNLAVMGGGMSNLDSSSPTVTDCFFSDNTASDWGGGMYCQGDSAPKLMNCIFSGNAGDWGGGMCVSDMTPSFYVNIEKCVFTNNTAITTGAGIHADVAYLNMINSILVNNTPKGAMSGKMGQWFITNCTFHANVDDTYGSISGRISGLTTITNSIFWGNTPTGMQLVNHPSLTQVNYCDIEGANPYPGTGCISADPQWVNPGSGDFHLKANSPCIDSGTNSAVAGITEDFEGDARIVDGDYDGTAIVDMGVDEADETRSVEIYLTLQGAHRPINGWEIPINIGFYPANSGTSTLLNPGSAIFYFSGTTTYIAPAGETGTRAFYLAAPVDPGIYDITADSTTTLLNVKREVTIP